MLSRSTTLSIGAGALFAGALFLTATVHAAPAVNPDIAKSGVTLVREGGHGGGGGGGGGGFKGGGGGGFKGGGGGGFKGFSGGGRSFSRGSSSRMGNFSGSSRGMYRSFNKSYDGNRGGKNFGWKGGGRGHHNHHRGRGLALYGLPYYGYYYDDYSSSYGCGWLHRRAIATDSPYWWNRYYACINGDY